MIVFGGICLPSSSPYPSFKFGVCQDGVLEAGEAEELTAVSWILRFLILLFCGPDEVVWVKLLALIFEVMEYLIIMRKFLIKTIIVTWWFKQTL